MIFSLLAWNLVVVVWGFATLDAAARDAARAAANYNNATDGLRAAQQAALAHTTDGYFVTQPTVRGAGAPATDFRWIDNPGGTTPPTGSPYVVVTTRARVRVPVALNFFGAQMANNQLFYNRTYVFPILKLPFTPPPPGTPDEEPAAPPPVAVS
ncbi:MAG: hypothetical protein C0507_23440, partial [Cyanobacteria bacterium PR.3.49]|nr:hypothetical protein [Cyanobacteria bacterium PR.3.49]